MHKRTCYYKISMCIKVEIFPDTLKWLLSFINSGYTEEIRTENAQHNLNYNLHFYLLQWH